MPEVFFKNDDHSYQSPNKKYLSATSLVDLVIPPFDDEYWSKYKTAQRILGKSFHHARANHRPGTQACMQAIESYFKAAGMYPKLERQAAELRKRWKLKNQASRDKGSAYHEKREIASYQRGDEMNPFDLKSYRTVHKQEKFSEDNKSLAYDLWKLEDGFYPELLLWNEVGLAGQADKVFIETTDKRYVDIDDYKTNKKISTRGYRHWDGTRSRLLKPLDHLEDCKLIHYTLQISIYAWMLEQFGFTVRNLAFHHFEQPYHLQYMRKEVLQLINHAISLGKLR